MKKQIVVLVFILSLAGSVFAGKPSSNCVDVPISWEFLGDESGPEAILSDGAGPYSQGINGVGNSVIHAAGNCAGSAQTSKDGTLAFSRTSTRKLRIKMGTHIDGSIIESGPVPFENSDFLTKGFLNIRNLIGYPSVVTGQAAVYYTKASGQFPAPNASKNEDSYHWVSIPDDYTCPAGETCVPNFTPTPYPANSNQPLETAWVKVTYMPRNLALPWSLSNTDKWLVEGETILPEDSIIQPVTFLHPNHNGQYSFPFKILVTALAKLP
jgi:hypothetical protein